MCITITRTAFASTSIYMNKKQEKPPLENWEKSYGNGEYMRSAEITEEQNYNMIDNVLNNGAEKAQREENKKEQEPFLCIIFNQCR